MTVEKKVGFRFLRKAYEGVVLGTVFNEATQKECYRLRLTSSEHIGKEATIPVDCTFANAKDAYTKLHIGNKVKYVSGDGIYTGVVIDVNEDSSVYTIKDLDKPTEIFYMDSAAFDANRYKGDYFLDKAIEELKGA